MTRAETRRPLAQTANLSAMANWLSEMLTRSRLGVMRAALADYAERGVPQRGIVPPPRADELPVTEAEATHIPAVHRALSIIATSITQMSLTVERGGQALADDQIPALIRRPSLDMTRGEFLEQVAMSMAATGNAYLQVHRGGPENQVIEVEPLNPHLVYPYVNRQGQRRFTYDGREYKPSEIKHIALIRLPGQLLGNGPLQAAQGTMRAARDMRDFTANWYGTGTPAGILSSDQSLTSDEAARYRNGWNHLDENGDPIPVTANPARIRVLGRGLKYQPVTISPKDALWIEAQNFTTQDIARLFGVPSSLMLTAIEGNSQTYSNVEQEWLGYVRFTLMGYLRRIEEALTDIAPRGQTVRFNIETLLRSDTKTRYEAHNTGLTAGFLTVNEVRAIENLAPLPGGDQLPTKPAPAEKPAPALPPTQETVA